MNKLLIALIIVWCLSQVEAEIKFKTVQINDGKLIGKVEETLFKKKIYYAFRGIPYAAPPIGNRRFKEPQPVESWIEPRNATQHGKICVQMDFQKYYYNHKKYERAVGSEDCLFLNVYTPNIPMKPLNETKVKLKPVMFFIHGGGFWTGSGDDYMYGPDFLIEENVVLVTINYRLGVLGFLSLENRKVPGNFGLKDQVFALKWVQNNIEAFGGDPNSVTIFGQEAGGASTSLLMVSPLARGLFHKVISQSGCLMNGWAVSSQSLKERAFILGEILFEERHNTTETLIAALRKVKAEFLANFSDFLYYVHFDTQYDSSKPVEYSFAPTIETKDTGSKAFLTVDPELLIKGGYYDKLPVMIGRTDNEFLIYRETDYDISTPILEDPQRVLENQMYFPLRGLTHSFNSNEYKNVLDRLKKMYKIKNSAQEKEKKLQLKSDIWFNVGLDRGSKWLTDYSNKTYVYQFSYEGDFNLVRQHRNTTHRTGIFPGSSNGDELCYQFRCKVYDNLYERSYESRRVIKMWTRLLTNFAKTGKPTPRKDMLFKNVIWKPKSKNFLYKSGDYYLEIKSILKLKKKLQPGIAEQWYDLMNDIREGVFREDAHFHTEL